MLTLKTQALVIGSGPGGAVTAQKLAGAGVEVLLVEEGIEHDGTRNFSVEEMLTSFRSAGITVAFGNPPVAYAEGRCLGGGSELNAGLFHRLPAEVCEQWRQRFALDGFTTPAIERIYHEIEKKLAIQYSTSSVPLNSARLKWGAEKLGWKVVEVPRWLQSSGDRVERRSMSNTYLREAESRGCRIRKGIRIERIEVSGAKAVQAHGHDLGLGRGEKVRIQFEKVFVCAGTIQTPYLLKKSGIGRGFGAHLGMHPTLKIVAEFPQDVQSDVDEIGFHQVKEFSPELSFGCARSSKPFLAAALVGFPTALKRVEADWKKMAVYYVMVCGQGSGSIRRLPFSRDPMVRYQIADRDGKMLSVGLKKLARLLMAAGATSLYPSVAGMDPLCNEAAVNALADSIPAKAMGLTSVHLFGSCSPFTNGRRPAPIDQWGRLAQWQNVHLNDGSILPASPGVNPQGTIMMMAQRNIEHEIQTP